MRERIGLVLGGGGARGAYEAGALHYICREIPRALGRPIRFDVIAGTSAGAINGAFLAAHAWDMHEAVERLAEIWRGISISDIYRFRLRDVWRVPRAVFRDSDDEKGPVALVDARPLHALIRTGISWPGIGRSIAQGHLEGFAVTATEVSTSRSIIFLQGRDVPETFFSSRNPYIRPREVTMGPEHILASSAIPLLFPPVQVDGHWFLDGGLGLNTPLRPALRLGATRILVMSLRAPKSLARLDAIAERRGGVEPTWATVIGKTMNAVLLDKSNHEVERMARINRMLDEGTERFGPEFMKWMGEFSTGERGAAYKRVESVLIAPSQDLGTVAVERVVAGELEQTDGLTGRVLRFLGHAASAGENDAMSYLLFDPGYIAQVMALGEADAAAKHDQLVKFFGEATE